MECSSYKSNAAKVSILLTEKLLFSYINEYICCFINPNQLYVKYICFEWFEYFWVCWTYQWYFGELNIVCGVWNELCDCVLRLGILNIVFGVWEIGVVTCLWIWECYHKLFWSMFHWCMITQSWGIIKPWALQLGSETRILEPRALQRFESETWLLESGTRFLEPGALLLSLGLYSWVREPGYLHWHTYIVVCLCVLFSSYVYCSFARWISMHMSFNEKEHRHISIDWLHDLRSIEFGCA
jgi:hypothetical protein